MAEAPSGTVTFLFTDLEGSTRLGEEHPDAMQGPLARHGASVRNAIARAPDKWRNLLLMLVILSFWTSFLLRVYAWIGLLSNNSWFNRGLTSLYNTIFGVFGTN